MSTAWKKAESDFEAHYAKYGKKAYVHHFTDTAFVKGTLGPKAQAFTENQPSDYLVCLLGDVFLAEVKSCSSETSFPKSAIRKGQLKAAKLHTTAGGKYYFFVKSEIHKKWYRIPAEFILNSEAKSHPWTTLEGFRYDAIS